MSSLAKKAAAGVAGLLMAEAASSAQAAYPERPISLIVPFSAGGGTDVLARTLAPYLEKYIGSGALPVSNSGLGASMHTSMLRFLRMAGEREGQELTVVHAPFPGSGPNRTALLGRHVAAGMMGLGEAAPLHNEGELRILATMAAERWELTPDAPTFREEGFDIVSGSYRGVAGPAGLPDDIHELLQEALRETIEDPEFQDHARQQVLPLEYIPSEEYRDMLAGMKDDMQAIRDETPWR